MATTIWKGHLSFGLVSIPVKLCRAARAEKVEFRHVHEASGSRVRQALYREPEAALDMEAADEERQEPERRSARRSDAVIPFPSQPKAVKVSRSDMPDNQTDASMPMCESATSEMRRGQG